MNFLYLENNVDVLKPFLVVSKNILVQAQKKELFWTRGILFWSALLEAKFGFPKSTLSNRIESNQKSSHQMTAAPIFFFLATGI